jgi:hypothetical protein
MAVAKYPHRFPVITVVIFIEGSVDVDSEKCFKL